jgi:uncharacterized protein (DUF427 family)
MSKAPTRTEPAPYRVRGWRGGKLIVNCAKPRLAWGVRPFAVWMFPEDAVHVDDAELETRHEGWVAVKWQAADEWWEEDERVYGGHPRVPGHRVDVRVSSRHIVVSHNGVVVAQSRRPVIVSETGMTDRYYLPRADLDFRLLRQAERTSWCPYKGKANYYDIVIGDAKRKSALWTYEQVLADTTPLIAGLIGIWHEKLDVTVDGVEL